MNTLKPTLMLSLALLISFTACKRDDDAPEKPTGITVDTTLLVNKPWKLYSVYYYDNNGKQDFMGNIHDCEKDNLLYFNSDGSARVEEGQDTCYTTDPIFVKGGNWQIDQEKKQLTITNDTDVQTFEVSSINDSMLTVFGRVNVNPFALDAEVTFKEERY